MVTIEQDKVEHFAFGFVLSFMGIIYLPLLFLGYAFGYGKELYDHKYGTGFDIDDLFATTLGAGLALVLVVVVI